MKPIEFPEQTVVIAKEQPQYVPLPAHVFAGDRCGRIACCWSLSWRERLVVLLTGRVWHEVYTFGGALQPQLLLADKPAMRSPDEGDRLVVRINGRVVPRRFLRVDAEESSFRFTPAGRLVRWVMRRIPGSETLATVTYPLRGPRFRVANNGKARS